MHLQKPTHEVVEFNNPVADYPCDLCIHQLFEAQAERTPEATAVVYEDQRLTYGELNSRVNRLAHYLRKRGARPEVLVGICVERSPDTLVGILGILKAGAAYVPLDPTYPKDRLAVILEDAKAPLVLTQQSLVSSLPRHVGRAICLDTDWPDIALESPENPTCHAKPNSLSYVLFTSGSTGRPKGVAIEHHSSVNFVQWAQSVFTSQEVEGTLFSTSVCFDLSVFEMFVPLSMGGKVIVVQNALCLPRSRAANQVTLINTVPSAIAELVRTEAVPASVQVINLAGEALLTSLAQRIYEKTSARSVYNLYGPTEYTTYATYTLVPRGAEVTIGRPLANTRVYILDEDRRPASVGVPGELFLAGDGLARGYFGRPDLTAERFLRDPFSSDPGARMYRTGDLASFLPDGNIRYLGRIDNQVKIRGFRIELGEIEARLMQHSSVQSAAVIAHAGEAGDKQLVAYVVSAGQAKLDKPLLAAFLSETLPEYMIPGVFVNMDALPLTPNGKVDRRALPAPELDQAGAVGTPARDELESVLLGEWRKTLANPAMGVTDNFFDFGGHSLTAARLLTEVQKVTGRQLPLDTLIHHATVEAMACLIRQNSTTAPDSVLTVVQEGNSLIPFFAIVPPGEDSLGYAILAKRMGHEQPLYRLQGREPVIAGQRPAFTQEELSLLSRQYIDVMRAAQPEGPYCFGGYCDGVQIAERMVLDLEAAGQEVGFLAIFDTWVLQNVQRPLLWRLAYYGERLQVLHKMNFGEQRSVFKQAVQNNFRRMVRPREPKIKREVQQAYWPEGFVAGRFRAPVALFKKPRQPFYYVNDPSLGWRARSEGGVEIHEVDFDHDEMFREPHVRTVGELLSARLRRVSEHRQAKRSSSGVSLVPVLSENV